MTLTSLHHMEPTSTSSSHCEAMSAVSMSVPLASIQSPASAGFASFSSLVFVPLAIVDFRDETKIFVSLPPGLPPLPPACSFPGLHEFFDCKAPYILQRFIGMRCTAIHYTALYCTVLYCSALYFTTLNYTALN